MSALASLLVRDQVVSVRTIEEAIQRQVISGGELDTVLLELAAVPEDTLAAYRGAVHGMLPGTRQQITEATPEALGRVSREVAERWRIVPLAMEGPFLTVAVAAPPDPGAWEQLAADLGVALSPRLVTDARLTMALAQHYGVDLPPRMRRLRKKLDPRDPGAAPYVKPPEPRLDPARFDVRPSDAAPAPVDPSAEGRSTMRFGVASTPAAQGAPGAGAATPADPAPSPPAEPQAVAVGVARVVGVGASPPATASQPAPAEAPPPASPPAAAGPPDTPSEPQEPPSISQAMERIGQASSRAEILDTLLAFARGQLEYAALFVVHDGMAEGRSSAGAGGASDAQVREMAVPLSAPSSLADVHRSAGPKVTRFDTSEVDETFVKNLGRDGAQPSVLLPVAIRQRVVLILYGDRGGQELGFADVPDLLGLVAQVGAAFERLIVQRKFRGYASPAAKSGDARLQPDQLPVTAPPKASRRSWQPPEAAPAGGRPSGEATSTPSAPAASKPASAPPASSIQPGAPMRSARRTVMGLPAADVPVADSWGSREPGDAPAPRAADAPAEAASRARPSAFTLLGVPRSAPPPPGAGEPAGAPAEQADTWGARDTISDAAPIDDAARAVPPPAEAGDDDEPELTVEYADADDDGGAEALEDYDPEDVDPAGATSARQDPRRDDPDGVATHDVVRLGRAAAAAADAIQGSHPLPGSPDPDPDQPSVIVDMGHGLEATVRDLSLSGPDDVAVVQRVLGQGEAILPILVQHFPGPLWFDRHRPYRRLPAGRDVSPIARALDAFGERAVPYAITLLSAHEGDTRFYAVLLAADMPHADLVGPLAARAFDPDPGVRARALEVLPRFAQFSEAYQGVLEETRKYARVPRKSPERRAQAVEALGHLRDVGAMDLLVKLLEDDEPATCQAARRSLVLLTCQDFGDGAKRWTTWLDKNGQRHRIEWLIDALTHSDEALRTAAGEELQQLTQQYFGFHPQLAKREREVMQRRYQQWWVAEGAARFQGA